MAYAKEYLLSCSMDKTIRVWRSAPGREILLYPWFETVSTIKVGSGLLKSPPVSINVMDRTETPTFYVGDDQGVLYHFHPPPIATPNEPFALVKPGQKVHSLSITKLLFVPRENFIITISFDNTCRVRPCGVCVFVCLIVVFVLVLAGFGWFGLQCDCLVCGCL